MDNVPIDLVEAERVQREVAGRALVRPLETPPRTIAALDAAYREDTVSAAVALYRLDPLELVEERVALRRSVFPYVPGYLFWREAPALLEALGALSEAPDLLLVEGQGIAHPRRCGIASHLGVLSGIPSIGCAKTRLIGTFEEPGREKGSWSPLRDGEVVGAVLRTRSGVKPLFVSVGHLLSLEEARGIVLQCCTEFRVPQPLRAADMAARKALRELIH